MWDFNGQCHIAQGDGFRVSYNPHTNDKVMAELMEHVTGEKMPHSVKETALIKGNQYFILTGDHRLAYEPLISKGFQACEAYYQANISQRSKWSSDYFADSLTH